MRFFSTFTGIGGFEVGIENALHITARHQGFEEKTKRQGLESSDNKLRRRYANDARFVGYSEIDKYAISVYERHFKGVRNYGDITKINAEELPDFDCLVGGFPCQAFSIAGKRHGFDDTRGTLFFDLARILKAKQPRLFVFENVKGLLSHDKGDTFRTIITTIDELGYDCQWQVLNSKNNGVPQNRERVIIVGHLRGTPRPEVFPISGETVTCSKESPTIIGSSQKNAKVSTDGIVPTLSSAMGMGGGQTPMVVDHGNARLTKIAQAVDANYWKGVDNHGQRTVIGSGGYIRRLTPLECERLQGFPDDWTKYGKDGETISDTQRYKMCGNAVTTNVIRNVFTEIFQIKGDL